MQSPAAPAHQRRLRRLRAQLGTAAPPIALAPAAAAPSLGAPTSSGGRLAGKVAVISGAGAGIGRQTMLTFSREGATVFGCGRTLATLEETAALVKAAGGTATVQRCDVSKGRSARP
jgi:hypothetical protein